MSTLLRVFKEIKEKNLEAKRIIEEAKKEAENLKKAAEQESSTVYKKAYEKVLEQAQKKAEELKKITKRDTETELQKIKSKSQKIADDLETKTEANFEKAVNRVLKIVVGEN